MKKTLTEKDSFVIFRNPGEKKAQILTGEWEQIDINDIGDSNGFIISDFTKQLVFCIKGEPINFEHVPIDINSILKNHLPDFDNYIEKVTKFIDECKSSSTIQKVILSRVFSYPFNIDILNYYKQINNQYENTFNCLFNHPELGTWIVATPEILLKGSKNNYTTVSLAGTIPADAPTNWQSKESEEQQFVTDYILNQINQIGKVLTEDIRFETIMAGKVKHRKTTIPFHSTEKPGKIASLLHPTPAIAGTPKQEAVNFILKNEGYNRKLYTGFLGYCSSQNINLYVNLRSAQISNNQINIYVGGGITKDSVPENEWNETILKSKTLLQILEN